MTCHLPDDLIVLISGVPGAGKTTISYELLKIYTEIRLIEETDIIRDILRGYNIYLKETCNFEFDKVCSHDIFLTYDMAKEQCKIMKESILNIIKRQQRKKIPTIINGVHIIPEELYLCTPYKNIVYINLYVNSENALWNRLKNRNPEKYKSECIPLLYQTNTDLNNSIHRIPTNICKVYSIDVSNKTIYETLSDIHKIFINLYGN